MYSFSWPDMFSYRSSNLNIDKAAVRQNLVLLLNGERGSLFGDPAYGAALKQVLFEPNNNVVKDLIIDELYSCIRTFLPQVFVRRNDIKISTHNKIDIRADIQVTYKLDNTSDLYSINLTSNLVET